MNNILQLLSIVRIDFLMIIFVLSPVIARKQRTLLQRHEPLHLRFVLAYISMLHLNSITYKMISSPSSYDLENNKA